MKNPCSDQVIDETLPMMHTVIDRFGMETVELATLMRIVRAELEDLPDLRVLMARVVLHWVRQRGLPESGLVEAMTALAKVRATRDYLSGLPQ